MYEPILSQKEFINSEALDDLGEFKKYWCNASESFINELGDMSTQVHTHGLFGRDLGKYIWHHISR